MPAKIRDLDTLVEVVTGCPDDDGEGNQIEYARKHGLPHAHGQLDMTELPVFGGSEPPDTTGVWSWDEARLLVGSCREDLRIVPRSSVRDTRIEFRATREEREEIAQRATAVGETVSDYLRSRALEG